MNLTAKNAWPLCAATWSPSSQHNFNSVPRRRPGRPPKRWDDELNKFVMSQFPGCSSWSDVAHLPRWPSTRHDFVQFDTVSQINELVTPSVVPCPEKTVVFVTRTGKVQSAKMFAPPRVQYCSPLPRTLFSLCSDIFRRPSCPTLHAYGCMTLQARPAASRLAAGTNAALRVPLPRAPRPIREPTFLPTTSDDITEVRTLRIPNHRAAIFLVSTVVAHARCYSYDLIEFHGAQPRCPACGTLSFSATRPEAGHCVLTAPRIPNAVVSGRWRYCGAPQSEPPPSEPAPQQDGFGFGFVQLVVASRSSMSGVGSRATHMVPNEMPKDLGRGRFLFDMLSGRRRHVAARVV